MSRVRAVLWQWGRCDARVDELIDQQRLAEARMRGLDSDIGGAAPMDGQPRGTVPGDPVYRAFEAREREKKLFADEIETCEDEMRRVKAFQAAVGAIIKELKPVERDVIIWRYRRGASWVYVGLKLNMDESTARRFEREACAKLAKKITMERGF